MAGKDGTQPRGPDAALFRTATGALLSARQVKQAVDAYQVYLDEPLRVLDPWPGIITARNVILWFSAGCPWDDLPYLIQHDRPSAPESASKSIDPAAALRSSGLRSIAKTPGNPADPPLGDWEPGPTLRSRLRAAATNPKAWMWVWVTYCGLGFGSRIFVQCNPDLTVWGAAIAVAVGLLGGAAWVFGAFLLAGAMMGRGYNDIRNLIVSVVVGVGTAFLASHAYGEAYDHFQKNQMAPLATLVDRCMAKGIRYESYRVGAVCRDGWRSGATGRGACSHHRGVAYWVYPKKQTRTVQECRQQASDISWRYRYSEVRS